MQTQSIQTRPVPPITAATRDSLLYRFEAQLTVQPIGLIPEGLLFANSFEGRVTHGMLQGARVWGVDHLLMRADGVSVIDAPKAISLGDRHVTEHVRGYCLPPAGLAIPPLEALLSPDFVWPDVEFIVRATSTFRTADPELAHLPSALARIDGTVSFTTGQLIIETRLLPSSQPTPSV